jgi:hypothetical protein
MRPLAVALLGLALALALPASAADGPTRRFAVVAGASAGGPGRTPLRYATSDARDVSRVLRRLGGVALDDLVLLEEPDAAGLHAAFDGVAAEAERARRAGQRVELFVYSGHSDEQGLLLGASRLDYPELRRELDRVPADVRVAILDSCASGAITRAKGGVHRPPFLLDQSSRVSGHAFLTSSAADEAAQESDRLHASFFTHALLTGLRGAADASGDGVVTLNEAYQFAFRETLASTEATQGGPQHATYDIGLVGSGDVVMTDLRRADAVLVVPEQLDGRVFVRNAAGQLVAELRKLRGARVELALEEGRYAVQVAQAQHVLSGSIELVASRRAFLDEARLSSAPLAPAVARGQGPGRPPSLPDEEPAAPLGTGPFGEVMITTRGGTLEHARPSLKGWAVDLALEAWRPDGLVGVELGTGFHRLPSAPGAFALAAPNSGYDYGVDTTGSVDLIPATFAGKLAVPGRSYRPYVVAGFGVGFVHAHYAPPAAATGILAPGRVDESTFTVGALVGAGLALRLERRVSAVLDARYAAWVPTDAGWDEVRLNAFQLTVGVSVSLF